MSGRQQRVMVQPIVRHKSDLLRAQYLTLLIECYLQKSTTGTWPRTILAHAVDCPDLDPSED